MPLVNAENDTHKKCVNSVSTIDAKSWGQILGAEDTALSMIFDDGIKPVFDSIGITSDAGWFDRSFLIFELPPFCTQAIFGKLRLKVKSAVAGLDPDFPSFSFVLYDIGDIPTLQKPVWDIDDFRNAIVDLSTGRIYGNFNVRSSPADDGVVIEIPLTYDAMYDINSVPGGTFAIGIFVGEGWIGEGDGVSFVSPDDGGLAQLELTMVSASHGKPRHHKEKMRE